MEPADYILWVFLSTLPNSRR